MAPAELRGQQFALACRVGRLDAAVRVSAQGLDDDFTLCDAIQPALDGEVVGDNLDVVPCATFPGSLWPWLAPQALQTDNIATVTGGLNVKC
jgi:hypothetical protein